LENANQTHLMLINDEAPTAERLVEGSSATKHVANTRHARDVPAPERLVEGSSVIEH
jgi:hypothetical protein